MRAKTIQKPFRSETAIGHSARGAQWSWYLWSMVAALLISNLGFGVCESGTIELLLLLLVGYIRVYHSQ